MKVHVLNTREEMGSMAGKAVEEKIIQLLKKQEEVRMIFAAAPSQNEFFAYLRQSVKIPWNRIVAFHMDEYIGLPSDNPQLFANFLKRNLFDKVPLKAVHLINGSGNIEEEIVRYERLLIEKPIDIVCLGIGENGHLAFNDPPVADFNDPKVLKTVDLDDVCRQQQVNDGCFPTFDDVPESALTLTIPTLMKGKYLFCIVPGKTKKDAVEHSLKDHITKEWPASALKLHENCSLYLDIDSYSKNETTSFDINIARGINCITGKDEYYIAENGLTEDIDSGMTEGLLVGPGLVDLQVNGVNGIDFNDVSLTPDEVREATEYMLSTGVTTYFPTVITNSEENIIRILDVLSEAIDEYPLVKDCVGGIHLEGPFLSLKDGARGAHDKQYIQPPNWELFEKFQKASGGNIRLVTLSPEWDGSVEFIKKCRKNDVLVSIGHSLANSSQIQAAVEAGATLSTHLGNGVPLMLPRHPNLIWDQLSEKNLYASIIADGFHLPDSFLKVVIKNKGDRAVLVSDATCFSGKAPGTYDTHIGDQVILNENGRLAMSSNPELLAGATKTVIEDIEHLLSRKIVTLATAWKMGSLNPLKFLGVNVDSTDGEYSDRVVIRVQDDKISIEKVLKNGLTVFIKEPVKGDAKIKEITQV